MRIHPRPALQREFPTWLRLIFIFLILYLFFLSIGLMSASFKLFGKGLATSLMALAENPFNGLFIGMLTTALVQSSSTTTSMVVGLVAAGGLNLPVAIPVIMGANIGTSITNTIVSLGHLGQGTEFRRAFAASIVHDMFNLLAVLVFFPLEQMFHLLERMAGFMGQAFSAVGGASMLNPLKLITKPLIHWIVALFHESPWPVLLLSLLLLFMALRWLTRGLKLLIIGKVEIWFQNRLFKNPLRALLLGLVLTLLVQSSSITTSIIVPIAAAGILTLPQVFPYTLGANIGTTVTALLAALSTGNITAITTSFAHILFNVLGTIAVWPFRSFPVLLADSVSAFSQRYRFFPLIYILTLFFVLPALMIYISR